MNEKPNQKAPDHQKWRPGRKWVVLDILSRKDIKELPDEIVDMELAKAQKAQMVADSAIWAMCSSGG